MLQFLDSLPETHPLIRFKRRAGRAKRTIKHIWWERNIGKEYKAWLAASMELPAGTIDNSIPIAVVVPVFDPPVTFLAECLNSVINQTTKNWQLIVSDDGSTNPDVMSFLEGFESQYQQDPRVTVTRNTNGGISAACNRGLEMVTTEFFGWLDHDDQLNPRAIEIFSEALEANPNALVIYSDEDKINAKGDHFELYCKPDFSPELLLTQMYLCHFTAFRTETVRALGGFRSSMDGAQDYDLALRLLPQLLTNKNSVIHVPHPLYHWRAWAQSTALTIEAKPWAQQATARAQQEHLQRTFGGGIAQPSNIPGLNDVHPSIPTTPRVSVIIPTIGTKDSSGCRFVDQAIASIRAQEELPLEIIAVTTGELDPIPGVDHQVIYRPTQGFNFAEAINLGRQSATGNFLLLLNDDTTVAEPKPVSRMLEIAQIDGVGITGALLTYPDGRIQHAGIVLLPSGPTHAHIAKQGKWTGYFGSTLTPRNYSAVTAAAMLINSAVFDELGGFDPTFARDFNDVDFCLRAGKAAYRVAWTPYAHFTHHEGASIVRKKADPAEHQLFSQRWGAFLIADPFYSPALNAELARIYEAR